MESPKRIMDGYDMEEDEEIGKYMGRGIPKDIVERESRKTRHSRAGSANNRQAPGVVDGGGCSHGYQEEK